MIRILAIITIITAIWIILILGSSYTHINSTFNSVASYSGVWSAVLILIYYLVPILKILAGIGLFLRQQWGRVSTLFVLIIDVLVMGISIVRYHTNAANIPIESVYVIPGAEIVETHSFVPNYFVTLISLLTFMLLIAVIKRRKRNTTA